MNKIGTKGILDDIEKETALRTLIVEYDENHNNTTCSILWASPLTPESFRMTSVLPSDRQPCHRRL
jgi:hypothetical protein